MTLGHFFILFQFFGQQSFFSGKAAQNFINFFEFSFFVIFPAPVNLFLSILPLFNI